MATLLQLGMFDTQPVTTQEETPPASLTVRQFCKSCRRKPAVQCDECRTWRKDYDSVRDCLLSAWPSPYTHTDSVTLRLRALSGDVTETGTDSHVKEWRSLLCMAGVGQEEA